MPTPSSAIQAIIDKCSKQSESFVVVGTRYSLFLTTFFRIYKRWFEDSDRTDIYTPNDIVAHARRSGRPKALLNDEERLLADTAQQFAEDECSLIPTNIREVAQPLIETASNRADFSSPFPAGLQSRGWIFLLC